MAYGTPRPASTALEDPIRVLGLWRDAGLPTAATTVVEPADAPAAAAELDRGHGTVWSAACWPAAYWVPDATDPAWSAPPYPPTAARAAGNSGAGDTAAGGVRVMPFLPGRPCGVHGIVLRDGVVALRPVEQVTVRTGAGRALRRIGSGTTWDPPAWARAELHGAARRVGAALASTGLRSSFAVRGVLTADGFRPTGCTIGWDPDLGYLDAALPELPYLLLHHALAAGEPAGVPAAELADLLVGAADDRRNAVVHLTAVSWPPGLGVQRLARDATGWRAAAPTPAPAAAATAAAAAAAATAAPTVAAAAATAAAAASGPGRRPAQAVLSAEPDGQGWSLRIVLDAGGLPRGPAIAGHTVELAHWLDATHGTGLGELVPGEDPPARPAVRRSLSIAAPLRRMPHRVLREMLRLLPADTPPDGPLGPVAVLEERIAALLGKPAALFFPSGTMAQQVALRVHAERTGRHAFAGHPQCHLDVWEGHGYGVLHGLRFHPVGDRHELLDTAELLAVGEQLAAVVWELPQRDIGGQLPSWHTLCDQVRSARERGAAAHLDGARLWEAQTFYRRPFSELAALFDTVYVSMYKSLEGVRGAVLAADIATIDQAAVWRRRLGGAIADAWPLAAAALVGLDQLLPRLAAFRDHAIAIGAAINADGTARTVPDPPQTPLFHVHLPVPPGTAQLAAAELLAEHGVQLFRSLRTAPDPSTCSFEVTVGENAMDFSPLEVVGHIRDVVHRAASIARSLRP